MAQLPNESKFITFGLKETIAAPEKDADIDEAGTL